MYVGKCTGKVHSKLLSKVPSGKWDWRVTVPVAMLSAESKENPHLVAHTIRKFIIL